MAGGRTYSGSQGQQAASQAARRSLTTSSSGSPSFFSTSGPWTRTCSPRSRSVIAFGPSPEITDSSASASRSNHTSRQQRYKNRVGAVLPSDGVEAPHGLAPQIRDLHQFLHHSAQPCRAPTSHDEDGAGTGASHVTRPCDGGARSSRTRPVAASGPAPSSARPEARVDRRTWSGPWWWLYRPRGLPCGAAQVHAGSLSPSEHS